MARIPGGRTSNWEQTEVIMERGDDIAKPGRTLIVVDEKHRERDFIVDSIKNQKPMEAGKSRGNVVTST